MGNRKKMSDSPKTDSDDFLEIRQEPHPFSFRENPNNPLNERLVEAINRMGGVGDDAEEAYQASLNALCRQAKEVVSIVATEYWNLPRDQYFDRWSLVQILTEMKEPTSLVVLDRILSSPIPPEQSRDPHGLSTVGEEVVIRTTAVDAVTRIAAEGNSQALDLLLKHVYHHNFSVKRASVHAYLEHGGTDAREVLLRVLPEGDRYILDIRRTDISEVPQIQGELHLACRDTDELPPRHLPTQRPIKKR